MQTQIPAGELANPSTTSTTAPEPEPPKGPEIEKDQILYTTSGRELVLPSRDLPVSREQLEAWGELLQEKIAADSKMWRGRSAILASIEYQAKIRGKSRRVGRLRL